VTQVIIVGLEYHLRGNKVVLTGQNKPNTFIAMAMIFEAALYDLA
jgi:hypothetical protein